MNIYVTPALIRAIFDAAYKQGVEAGSSASTSHEWGNGYFPTSKVQAWKDVEDELNYNKLPITSPQFWDNI